MATKTRVKFNVQKWANAVKKELAAEQTRRFVEYARKEVGLIGDRIMSYNSKNHMDRYGNLLDSLCWGVAFGGELVDSGFYRNPSASSLSYLHEFFPFEWQEAVYGRGKAEEYIRAYKPQGKGWYVFFAILAPYWGYWESGFKIRGFGKSSKFLKFNVMTQAYDEVKKDLKPAEVHITVTEKVRYSRPQLKKTAKRYSEKPDKKLEKRFNPKTPF